MTMKDRPYFHPGCHPVELGKYVLITPPIYRLFQALCRLMIGLKPGCLLYGESGIGKTLSILALTALLQSKFENLSVQVHSMKEHRIKTEGEFLTEMLRSFQYPETYRGNVQQKFDILVDYFVEVASKNDQNRLLLFLDEAQSLNTSEYGYLRGIYNDLQNRGVVSTFVLVGNNNLKEKFELYEREGQSEITGRFNNIYELKGIRGKEVKFVLNEYDTAEEPNNSGWSYTKYYFPAAFEAGWRLSTQAKIFWNTYRKMVSDSRNGQPAEIPMSHLVSAIQYFLCTFSNLEVESPVISKATWREAIEFAISTHRGSLAKREPDLR